MQLENQTNAVGSEDAPELLETLVKVLVESFPNTTPDNLVCEPDDAISFCNKIRKEMGFNKEDHEILRSMINYRKDGKFPTGIAKKKRKSIKQELVAAGVSINPVDFRDTLEELRACVAPSFTLDEHLFRPLEVKELCDIVRRDLKLPKLSNYLICSCLMNYRKNP